MRSFTRAASTMAAVACVGLFAACGGGDAAAGTYEHAEEGTIVLNEDGTGTWTQSGDPFEFTWEQEGETVTFVTDGGEEADMSLVDGDLVIPPEFISGDDPVTFARD